MLGQRGRYLAFFDEHDRAIAAFEQALALDPNSKSAQQGLSESRKKLPVSKAPAP
jgi:tetratricopeptide (TPR) repeat protein